MTQKIRKGDVVIYKRPFTWPEIATIIECLPKKKFYIEVRFEGELIVTRKEFIAIPSKYRLLNPEELSQPGDQYKGLSRWVPVTFGGYTVGNNIYRRLI